MVYQQTSRDAWRQFAADSATVDEKILAVIRAEGEATCDRIEACTGLSHQTVSGNMRHLAERTLIERTGRKAPTRKGRTQAMLWRLVKQGSLVPVARRASRAAELEEELRRVARQLEQWATEAQAGGWSTIHVAPMRREAERIYARLGRGA